MATSIPIPVRNIPVKSTIVRANKLAVPTALRWTSRLLAGSRRLMRLAQRLFFTPPRASLREAERLISEGGRQFPHPGRRPPLAGWRWGEGPVVLLVHGWAGTPGR